MQIKYHELVFTKELHTPANAAFMKTRPLNKGPDPEGRQRQLGPTTTVRIQIAVIKLFRELR